MRFLFIVLLIVGALVGLSYCSVVSEHAVLTQIETSIASPEEISVGRSADSGGEEASSTENDDNEGGPLGGLLRLGARNDDVAAFDIAGDADEIGFNCPFGIEALDAQRIAMIDPSADRILLYSLSDDKVTAIAPLQRTEGYDVIAAVAHAGDLYIAERSLTGRGDVLRRFSFNDTASSSNSEDAGDVSATSADEPPQSVMDQLINRGYTPTSGRLTSDTLAAENAANTQIVRTQSDTGSISATSADGAVTGVDYDITDERFLKLTRRLASGETADVVIHGRRPISVVRQAQINENGDIYLSMTEELRQLNIHRSDETIIKAPASADEDVKLFYVPRSRVCTPRQNTAISPTGEVISLFVRRNDVSLVKLRPKGQWQWRVRTARDTTGVLLTDQFRSTLKPVDQLAAKYPDFADKLPDRPALPGRSDDDSASGDSASGDIEPETSLAEDTEEAAPVADTLSADASETTAASTDLNDEGADALSIDARSTEMSESEAAAERNAAYAAALEEAFIRVSAGETIDRRSIVNNACMYLNLRYEMGEQNYEPETAFHYGEQSTVTSACASRGNHNLAFWSRPGRLSGKVGEEITSAPYVWAGSDWPWQFVDKIAAGRPAGDVCTKIIIYDAKSAVNSIYAAGVDCSGFVSRAWGKNARYTTRSIPDAATEITFEELQPGDVLNKAGNHVVMFLYWRGADEMEIIEATTNRACGGVCSRTRKTEEFQGYQAYRPNHVAAGGALTVAEVQQICQSATVAMGD
ncbi:MAG: hypothetical protein AAF224_12790 [Pseudomonadota bacterium]